MHAKCIHLFSDRSIDKNLSGTRLKLVSKLKPYYEPSYKLYVVQHICVLRVLFRNLNERRMRNISSNGRTYEKSIWRILTIDRRLLVYVILIPGSTTPLLLLATTVNVYSMTHATVHPSASASVTAGTSHNYCTYVVFVTEAAHALSALSRAPTSTV